MGVEHAAAAQGGGDVSDECVTGERWRWAEGRRRGVLPASRGTEYCLRCLPHQGVDSYALPYPCFFRSDSARQGNRKREGGSGLLTSSGAAYLETELEGVIAWAHPFPLEASHPR